MSIKKENIIENAGRLSTGILIVSTLGGCQPAIPTETELPPGYSWGSCKNISATIPVPDGWHLREERKSDTSACFVTREQIATSGIFETGLSINAIPRTSQKTGQKPSEFARDYIKTAGGGRNMVEKTGEGFKSYQITTQVDAPQLKRSIMMIIKVTGNDRADLTYLITFEAPVNNWPEYQQTGEIMIDRARLDPNFSGK